MEAKVNDLLKSGVVLIKFEDIDKFINYAIGVRNLTSIKPGSVYGKAMIFTMEG